MRLRIPVLLFLATSALAQPRISSISPGEINVNSGEHTVTISGGGFSPSSWENVATFRGPAGEYSVAASSGSTSTLYVWVPSQVVYTVGTYEVTIRSGNADSAPATFTVRPNGGPTLFLPSRVTTEATGPDGAVVTYSGYATAADGSAATLTCAPESGSRFPVDLTSVRCTGVDDSGGRTDGMFWVHVTDYTAPMIGVPEEVLARATSAEGAIVTWEAIAIDTVDTDVAVQCYPASGTFFRVGTTEVRCQAVDDHHNSAYGYFPVTVVDDGRPKLHLPDDIEVPADAAQGSAVHYTANATDKDGNTIPAHCTPETGSLFPIGRTSVSCTATDVDGHSSTGTFWVTVTPGSGSGTTLTLPEDITVQAEDDSGAVVTFTATAKDADGNDVAVSCMPPSGTRFPVGTTTVSCTANDAGGGFSITVTPRPTTTTLTLPDHITVEAESEDGAAVTFTATAHDQDGDEVPVTCAPASGSQFPVGTTTVTCTANDASGSFTVTVTRDTSTTLHLPDGITVDAESEEGAVVTFTATATDEGGNSVVVTCNPASGSQFPTGSTTVTCTAREATGTFTVTVNPPPPPPDDTTAPVIRRITASPNVLWPVDRKFHQVTIAVDASDDLDPDPAAKIIAVAVNEPGGNDVRVTSPLTVELRATRDANSDEDRIYTITVEVTDDAGNATAGTVEVRVPHDNSGSDALLSKQPPTLRKGKDRSRGTGGG